MFLYYVLCDIVHWAYVHRVHLCTQIVYNTRFYFPKEASRSATWQQMLFNSCVFWCLCREFLRGVEAVVGEYDQRVVDRGEQRFGVKNVKLHGQYHHTLPMNYDIALLELRGYIHFSKFLKFFFFTIIPYTKLQNPFKKNQPKCCGMYDGQDTIQNLPC